MALGSMPSEAQSTKRWKILRTSQGRNHGKNTGKSWENMGNHPKIIAKTPENMGKVKGTSEKHGKIMGKSENHGNCTCVCVSQSARCEKIMG
jgi:hypothetical protein